MAAHLYFELGAVSFKPQSALHSQYWRRRVVRRGYPGFLCPVGIRGMLLSHVLLTLVTLSRRGVHPAVLLSFRSSPSTSTLFVAAQLLVSPATPSSSSHLSQTHDTVMRHGDSAVLHVSLCALTLCWLVFSCAASCCPVLLCVHPVRPRACLW